MLAKRFREAIEACDKHSLFITLQEFPHGACGDAALLLAKYLEGEGYGPFQYMLGRRNGCSHAWLQQDALVVDITGDQFADMPHGIFVDLDSEWHRSFGAKAEHVADFEIYDDHTKRNLRNSYVTILQQLRSSSGNR
jgi:hypothetical protein